MKKLLSVQPIFSPTNRFDNFSPILGGCSKGLDAFVQIYLQTQILASICRDNYLPCTTYVWHQRSKIDERTDEKISRTYVIHILLVKYSVDPKSVKSSRPVYKVKKSCNRVTESL